MINKNQYLLGPPLRKTCAEYYRFLTMDLLLVTINVPPQLPFFLEGQQMELSLTAQVFLKRPIQSPVHFKIKGSGKEI